MTVRSMFEKPRGRLDSIQNQGTIVVEAPDLSRAHARFSRKLRREHAMESHDRMPFVSLFNRLGVHENCSDADVEVAFQTKLLESEATGTPVSSDVIRAYRVLRTARGRQTYLEFLEACDGGFPVEVPPDEVLEYQAFWMFAGIRAWQIPGRPNWFELRRSDQDPPKFVTAATASAPSLGAVLIALWRFVTFRPFIGAGVERQIGLVFVYALVIGLIAYGVDWGSPRFTAWQQARLRDSVEANLADAHRSAEDLEQSTDRFASSFRSATGVTLGASERSRELDLLIRRHASVADALAEIENSRVSAGELTNLRTRIRGVRERVNRRVYRESDDEDLRQMIEQCQSQVHANKGLARELDHIDTMIRAHRLNVSLDATERRFR